MKTEELIAEVNSLPLEERAALADSLLKSLNPPEAEIDKEWSAVAERRLAELRSGKVTAIPGDEVFARVRDRFSR
jgi:putative addiction module component (TIGR02574 family)